MKNRVRQKLRLTQTVVDQHLLNPPLQYIQHPPKMSNKHTSKFRVRGSRTRRGRWLIAMAVTMLLALLVGLQAMHQAVLRSLERARIVRRKTGSKYGAYIPSLIIGVDCICLAVQAFG
jgi:hypothetical protein